MGKKQDTGFISFIDRIVNTTPKISQPLEKRSETMRLPNEPKELESVGDNSFFNKSLSAENPYLSMSNEDQSIEEHKSPEKSPRQSLQKSFMSDSSSQLEANHNKDRSFNFN